MQLRLVLVLLSLLASQLVHGQGPTDDIVETAVKNGQFTTLVQALQAADLVTTLKGPGPYTVFAPTDDAFKKLPDGTVTDLLKPENKEKLANILRYHVVTGNVTAAAVKAMTLPAQVDTLSTQKFIADSSGNSLKVNDATITTTDVFATNGVIHIIDTVLLPPSDLVQIALDNGNFKTLTAALTAAGLDTPLKGPGPFTLFAPTDAAFEKLPPGVVNELVKPENKDSLAKILQYHVTSQLYTAASINRLALPVNITMLAGGIAKLNKNGNDVTINDVVVTDADTFASNGLIHIIDQVILPPLDIVETAITNGNFQTLITALKAADLIATLKGAGPLTVLAPTDAAFAKLPDGTVQDLLKPENKDKLTNILKFHVINKQVSSADIKRLSLPAQIDTLSDAKPIADINGDNIRVNTATVTTADVANTNGLIHVIDTVLLPPTDVVQTALDNGNFKTLTAALTAAGLVTALKGPGPFTVFAPTDAAFAKLPPGVVDELVKAENKDSLAKILQYHVSSQLYTAASINRIALPTNITMLAGGTARLNKNGNDVTINGATVSQADIFNSNGLIHIIDQVILPPLDIVETAITNGNFQTLITALKAADLVATLKGAGPLTVLAPTDAAFAKLPDGTLADLLKPGNKDKLTNILKYHVINKQVSSADIKQLNPPAQLDTLSGSKSIVDVNGNDIRVNTATVVTADVANTNGLIHVIDTVLLPPTDLVQTALDNGNFKKLVNALIATNLANTLKGPGPFTVFAPTDTAFDNLPNGLFDELNKAENKDLLGKILQYHVTSQLVTSSSINRMTLPTNLTMLAGGVARVNKNGNTVQINQASVTTADVFNANGMIHVIDSVILPSFDIVEKAITKGDLKTLVTALRAAELISALKETGPFTVFAPNDAAFAKLPNGTIEDLLKPESKEKLTNLLKYHVIRNQKITTDDLLVSQKFEMLGGGTVEVTKNGDEIKVNNVKIIEKNLDTTNGIIHVIETVLSPQRTSAMSLHLGQTLLVIFVSSFLYVHQRLF